MNRAARSVFQSVPDICIAYGVSDEYSFVFHRSTILFERRASKIVSTVVSAFTAAYIFHWNSLFGYRSQQQSQKEKEKGESDADDALKEDWLPTFDGRAVCYPSLENLRDYLSWRQVDCHVNNLYNTTFWALVLQGGHTSVEAENLLKGTFAADKNEILFSQFGINYNNEDEMFKKGSVVFREYQLVEVKLSSPITPSSQTQTQPVEQTHHDHSENEKRKANVDSSSFPPPPPSPGNAGTSMSKSQTERAKKARQKAKIVVQHVDIIKDDFWNQRPWILSGKPGVPLSD